MFCNKCGNQIDDGAKFCNKCGNSISALKTETVSEPPKAAPIAEEAPVVNAAAPQTDAKDFEEQIPASEFVEKVKKPFNKKKMWKIIGIVGGSIATLALAFVLLWNFVPQVKHFFLRTFMKPSKYYAYVENENIGAFFDSLRNNLIDTDDVKADSKISVEVSDAFVSFLKQAGLDIDLDAMSLDLDVKVNKKDDKISLKLDTGLNDSEIADGEITIDLEEGKLYGSVPILSDETFVADFEDDLDVDMGDLSEVRDVTPSTEQMDAILTVLEKYSKVIIENGFDFEKSSDKLTVDGVTAKYTLFTADVDTDDLMNLALVVLNEIKNDDETLEFVCDEIAPMVGYDGISPKLLKQGINYVISELEDIDDVPNMKLFTYKVWIDSKGDVMGREITVNKELTDGVDVKIGMYNAVKGGKQGTSFAVEAGDVKVELSGTAKCDGDMLENGNYVLEVSEGKNTKELIKIDLDHYDVSKPATAQFDAKFTIELGEDLIELLEEQIPTEIMIFVREASITVDMETTGSSSYFSLAANLQGEELVAITFDNSIGKSDKISVPSDTVNIDRYESTFNNEDDIIEDLLEKLDDAGIDLEKILNLFYFQNSMNKVEQAEQISPDYSDADEYYFVDGEYVPVYEYDEYY